MEVTLEEGRFVYPYLTWLRHTKRYVPVAYGVKMATGGMKYIDDAATGFGKNVHYAMLDWRKFDKRTPP